MELCKRLARGLLPYEKFDKLDLQAFAAAHGITPAKSKTKKGLVRALEQGDDTAVFDRLLDLSGELRNRIYGMYLEEFDFSDITPSQPPLALVSRQVRAEVLPLFYSSCRFSIWIKGESEASSAALGSRAVLQFATKSFLDGAKATGIANMTYPEPQCSVREQGLADDHMVLQARPRTRPE